MRTRCLTFLLLLTAVLQGCGSKEGVLTEKVAAEDSVLLPDTEGMGLRIYLYDRGRITTEILSEKMVRFIALDSTMAWVVDVDAFDSTGQTTGELVGDSAVIRESSNQMEIFGHVVLITENKRKLETEYLRWDSKTNLIETDAFVKITQNEDVWTGTGLKADQGLTWFEILDFKGTMTDAGTLLEP